MNDQMLNRTQAEHSPCRSKLDNPRLRAISDTAFSHGLERFLHPCSIPARVSHLKGIKDTIAQLQESQYSPISVAALVSPSHITRDMQQLVPIVRPEFPLFDKSMRESIVCGSGRLRIASAVGSCVESRRSRDVGVTPLGTALVGAT